MIRTHLRATERRQDTLRLARPQVIPLMGDGYAAQAVTSPLRGGPDSYLRQTRRGGWEQVFIVPTRAQLVAARYEDWLWERDHRRVAA
jgi:hypothetical protein